MYWLINTTCTGSLYGLGLETLLVITIKVMILPGLFFCCCIDDCLVLNMILCLRCEPRKRSKLCPEHTFSAFCRPYVVANSGFTLAEKDHNRATRQMVAHGISFFQGH